jgi:hypothetical protein
MIDRRKNPADNRRRRVVGRLLEAVDRIISAARDAAEARADLARLAGSSAPVRLAEPPEEEAPHAHQ